MINILYNCFKHWSKSGSVYFISDMHFGDAEHFKLLKANNKVPEGINSVEELDELQIKNINEAVHKNDTLICLGDVGDINYVKRLKAGYKVLITGNHDRGAEYYKRQTKINTPAITVCPHCGSKYDFSQETRSQDLICNHCHEVFGTEKEVFPDGWYEDNKLFDEVYTGPLMISDKIILSHEPIIPCPSYIVNLCGHVHAKPHKFNIDGHDYYNFCAEAIDYTPVSLGKLIKNGLLSKVDDIHRVTIDGAIIRKAKRVK